MSERIEGPEVRAEADTLGDALPREVARVRDDVLPAYEDPELKGAGFFAIDCMKRDLEAAEKAIAAGDVVAMLRAYAALKEYDT